MFRKTLFVLASAAVLCAACTRPVATPTISFSPDLAALPAQTVEESIVEACELEGWEVRAKRNSVVQASYNHKNKHFVTVNIINTGKGLSIRYVASKNMKYEEHPNGEVQIQRHYNEWVGNLAQTIRRCLDAHAASQGL